MRRVTQDRCLRSAGRSESDTRRHGHPCSKGASCVRIAAGSVRFRRCPLLAPGDWLAHLPGTEAPPVRSRTGALMRATGGPTRRLQPGGRGFESLRALEHVLAARRIERRSPIPTAAGSTPAEHTDALARWMSSTAPNGRCRVRSSTMARYVRGSRLVLSAAFQAVPRVRFPPRTRSSFGAFGGNGAAAVSKTASAPVVGFDS